MNRNKLLETMQGYARDLDFVNAKPKLIDSDTAVPTKEQLLSMAAYLLEIEIEYMNQDERFLDENYLQDVRYTLGFVQGILISTNFYTLHKIKRE